eukprot:3134886-Rhodomonas_salina.1
MEDEEIAVNLAPEGGHIKRKRPTSSTNSTEDENIAVHLAPEGGRRRERRQALSRAGSTIC